MSLSKSGYRQLAADINHNGTITTFDGVELRKLILGIYSKLPAYDQPWRFVPERVTLLPAGTLQKDFDGLPNNNFGDVDNPFSTTVDNVIVTGAPYTEPDWAFNMKTGNNRNGFDAVKIGDITGDVLLPTATGEECPGDVAIVMPNGPVNAGETIELQLNGYGVQNIGAFQLGFSISPSDFQFLESGSANLPEIAAEPSFGGLSEGNPNLKVVWLSNNLSAKTLTNGGELFKVKLKAMTSIADLSQVVHLDKSVLEGFFLSPDGDCMNGISLQMAMTNLGSGAGDRSSAISQTAQNNGFYCVPNPMSNAAVLLYDADAEFDGLIRYHDQKGRLVLVQDAHFSVGRNEIAIKSLPDLPEGILSISVNDGRSTRSIRIIKIN